MGDWDDCCDSINDCCDDGCFRSTRNPISVVPSSHTNSRQNHQHKSSFLDCFSSSSRLPPSLPPHWPNSTEADLLVSPNRVVNINGEQAFSFASNFVKTSKYEAWNFLPKFLLEEFNPRDKIANCYFLIISALQCVPLISNTGGFPTTLLPLSFIVAVDAIFQIYEDSRRHAADSKANAEIGWVLNTRTQRFDQTPWANICVGDIIRVHSRETIPVDALIIRVAEKSSPPTGLCFVETMSLDGETNLKSRYALSSTMATVQSNADLSTVTGKIVMEHPNKSITTFNGSCHIATKHDASRGNVKEEPILVNNILLRGCILRNTDWVDAVVMNTGHDTKIFMNSMQAQTKVSLFQLHVGRKIQYVIVMLAVLCVLFASLQGIFNDQLDIQEIWYLDWKPEPVSTWILNLFYFFLLHATFIPVSLYVTLSMVRFFQSYMMQNDIELYTPGNDRPIAVRTMTLNEELGQISHIFSDKTGTLTCNRMEFRKAVIGGKLYGEGITEIGKAVLQAEGVGVPSSVLEAERRARENAVPYVAFYCSQFEKDFSEKWSPEYDRIQQFFRTMSLCHDAIVEKLVSPGEPTMDSVGSPTDSGSTAAVMETKSGKQGNTSQSNTRFSASNPDDEAFVHTAAHFGFRLTDRQTDRCVIWNEEQGKHENLKVLLTIPFSSTRKRMTVVVEGENPDEVLILTKGADTVIIPRLSEDARNSDAFDLTQEHVSSLLREGLRCLYYGQSIVNAEDFDDWYKDYQDLSVKHKVALSSGGRKLATRVQTSQPNSKSGADTNTAMSEVDRLSAELEAMEEQIESDLELLGVVAVEDQLQEGVRDCIETLRNAGISIWMLTGDKTEAAWSIGLACGLVTAGVSDGGNGGTVRVNLTSDVAQSRKDLSTVLTNEIARLEVDLDLEDSEGVTLPHRTMVIDGAVLALLLIEQELAPGAAMDGISAETTNAAQELHRRRQSITGGKLHSSVEDPGAAQHTSLAFLFFTLVQYCQTCLACRVSPDQKRQTIAMYKRYFSGELRENLQDDRHWLVRYFSSFVTSEDSLRRPCLMAVGDGANDVAMLQEAHVGIGIAGQEGMQATLVSDYAIGQFRCLQPLLLHHGRLCYIRQSNTVLYILYKNVLLSMTQAWYHFRCAFSGQKWHAEGLVQLYNLVFTAFPIIFYAAYDYDVSKKLSALYPAIYQRTVRGEFFSTSSFRYWICNALGESLVLSIVPLFLLDAQGAYNGGTLDGFAPSAFVCFTCVVIVVNGKLYLIQSRWSRWSHALPVVSVGLTLATAWVLGTINELDYSFHGTPQVLARSYSVWLTATLLVLIIICKDVYIYGLERAFSFQPEHILQEIEVYRPELIERKVQNIGPLISAPSDSD